MKKQIIVIHGGDTFETYEEYIAFLKDFSIDSLDYFTRKTWKETLSEKIGSQFEVIVPKMPNKTNAKYSEWKIWFEKLVPLLNSEIVLVGHSLGGIFLAKYLSENILPRKIKGAFLVAAPYDDKDADYSLADFNLSDDLGKLQSQSGKLFIFHSKDDPVVPFADFEKYKSALPDAHTVIFENRGHFNQEEFPELVDMIKEVCK